MSFGPGSQLPGDAADGGARGVLASQTLATPAQRALAREALRHYDFSPRATLTPVTGAGCSVFRIDDPVTDERAALRLHRRGQYDLVQVKSELQWLDALRRDRRVEVQPPITTLLGDREITLEADDGRPQLASVVGWMEGASPDPGGDRVADFRRLGIVAARLHDHASSWVLPPGFIRPSWTADRLLGPHPTFGDWRRGIGVSGAEHAVLQAAEDAVRLALATFDTTPAGYGLVHANLRLSNLRLSERDGREVIGVLRFDDCGPSWFMYDFGPAVSQPGDVAILDDLIASWCDGYRSERALAPHLEAQLLTFAMLQRLVLVGWTGTVDDDGPDATALGAAFTASACELAERYLRGAG